MHKTTHRTFGDVMTTDATDKEEQKSKKEDYTWLLIPIQHFPCTASRNKVVEVCGRVLRIYVCMCELFF